MQEQSLLAHSFSAGRVIREEAAPDPCGVSASKAMAKALAVDLDSVHCVVASIDFADSSRSCRVVRLLANEARVD